MTPFLFASASDLPAGELLDDCLGQLGAVPPQANLGFIYATDRLADELPGMVERLQQQLPGVQWTGTVGMGLCAGSRELYDCSALTLMVGDFSPDAFRITAGLMPGARAPRPEVQDWWQQQDYYFALLHGDPTNPLTSELLERLTDGSIPGFINGGLTSSSGANPQIAGKVLHGGLSGVLFNDQVEVLTDHSQGCSPIGPVHNITAAQRNIAQVLDHRPALDVLKEDIGEVLAKNLSSIAGYIFAALPIQGSDSGDYLVRNLIGLDTGDGRVAVGDMIEDKPQLMFCRRDGNTAREDMARMLDRLAARADDRPIRGGIYVSCLGRGRYQFGDNSEELKMIHARLGDFPLVGFFANGEIYNGRLYGYTGVLTLFM